MASIDTTEKPSTTRDSMKRAFLDIYRKKPLHSIYVSELVKVCNISRGTFYFYYDNIEQLYHECEQDLINKMEDGLDEVILCTVGTSREDMTRYIKTYANHLSRYPEYLHEYHCLLEGSEEASFRKRWINSVYRHFKMTLPFSCTSSTSMQEHLLQFYSGGSVAMLCNWVLSDCAAPPEEIATIAAQTLFQGTFLRNQP